MAFTEIQHAKQFYIQSWLEMHLVLDTDISLQLQTNLSI